MNIKINHKTTLSGHRNSIYGIDVGINNGEFITAGGDGLLVQWNPQLGDTGKVLLSYDKAIYCIKTIPLLRQIWIGDIQGNVMVVHNQEVIKLKTPCTKAIHCMTYNDNGSLFIGSADGFLMVYDTTTFKLQASVQVSTQAIRSMCYINQNNELALGVSDNNIYLIDLQQLNTSITLNSHRGSVYALAICSKRQLLISGSRDAQLKFYDIKDGFALVHSVPAHMNSIYAVSVSPCGKLLATASRDKSIKLWSMKTFALLKVIDFEKFEGHTASVNNLLWVNNSLQLATVSDDRSIHIWDIYI